MVSTTPEAEAYSRHMNLKLAAAELGIPWQTLYVRLKRVGVQVVGDKLRYGTDRDKLGALGERLFKTLVPASTDRNEMQFQAKYDFDVFGYKVDVKTGKPRQMNYKYAALSWSFSFKRQALFCDFIVCFCLDEQSEIEHVLLVPSEFFQGLQTCSVSRRGYSKWLDYAINPNELQDFFQSLPSKEQA